MLLMMGIGVYYYRRTRNMSDYFLGNRKLGAWVTSMSAEASDMSGWMLMGVPGFAYVAGLNAGWIALGIILGTWANWHFIAARLRVYTEAANNSLTLPDFFENRFQSTTGALRVVPAIFILIFFILYTSSGFVAAGRLFETIFSLPYVPSLLLGAGVVVFYTLVGGFLAVSRTDFIQGVMMFFAILVVPVGAALMLGGFTATAKILYAAHPSFFAPLTKPDGSTLGLIEFVSLMAWVVISLGAALLVGMVGAVYLRTPLTGTAAETVFLVMAGELFPPIAAGLILAAVLAAIMSTASAQLLVAASAFAQDIYRRSFRPTARQEELVWVSRLSVLAIAAGAIYLGLSPDNFILDMVAYAWAGFGAAFGPALLMCLFWRRTTERGVLAGIVTGGVTVLVWKQLALFGLYEIVPGFFFSLLAIYVVSVLDAAPPAAVTEIFDRVDAGENRV